VKAFALAVRGGVGRILAFAACCLMCVRMVSAAEPVADPAAAAPADFKLLEPKPLTVGHKVVTLFPAGHPALKPLAGYDQEEKFKISNARVAAVTNIHNPSIELYLAPPEKANGMSVILSPGGGNTTCNVGSEGTDIAAWFNSLGVSCFVHRYRLKPYGSGTDALAETQRAVRLVRANAKEWNIDRNKIGHMGFSAGGEQTAALFGSFSIGIAGYAAVVGQIILMAAVTAGTSRQVVNQTLDTIE